MNQNNYAHYFCSVMIERFISVGIDHFFIGPGSRSTPIVSAIVRNSDAKIFLGIDERTVGFMALGYGKGAQKPGVIVVTSGTAAANLYPAICEAYLSSVPILVITADRPFELHDCGANQTMFQAQMFERHINKSFDIPPPSSIVPLKLSMSIIDQAVCETLACKPGPVHINMQLREPLANVAHEHERVWCDHRGEENNLPPLILPKKSVIDATSIALLLHDHDQGLIAVGELLPSDAQDVIGAFSLMTGWPIYADVSSNLRLRHHPNLLTHGDLMLLRAEKFAGDFDLVVKFGSRIVSKRFWHWIESLSKTTLLSLSEKADRIDHTGSFTHVTVGDLSSFLSSLMSTWPAKKQSKTTKLFERARHVDRLVDNFLEHGCDNEGYYAARLIMQIPRPTSLFLSSGMPIRDVDQFARPTHSATEVFVNRGVSGIDGIMSTAIGVSIARQQPMVVLLGDIAFLHDTNALMLIAHAPAPMLVVVINNNGGGIFHFLPIAQETDVVSPYLDTPHSVNIKSLCAAHQIHHRHVNNPCEFDEAIAQFFIDDNSMVIEVAIDRATNVRLHKELYERIALGDQPSVS